MLSFPQSYKDDKRRVVEVNHMMTRNSSRTGTDHSKDNSYDHMVVKEDPNGYPMIDYIVRKPERISDDR